MKVLVGCEFSGRVREAFAAKGHDAWSCDLEPTEIPSEKHLQCDIRDIIDNIGWDMLIVFPPCTHLAVSGAVRFKNKLDKQKEALEFVKYLLNAPIEKIALENPVGVIGTKIRKATQYIQPYEFGIRESKKTGLWLKNLPKLVPTKIVKPPVISDMYYTPGVHPKDKAKFRSRTFIEIANAMAEQWG